MRSLRTSPRRASARSSFAGACATGAFRASATGARRSPSFIARSAAPCRCRRKTCRSCCRKITCRTAAAIRCSKDERFLATHVPDVRRPRAARDGHDGHVRRFVLVLHALLLPGREHHGRRACRPLDADGPVHRRHRARGAAPAVRALLDEGDARPRPREVRRAVHAPVHAGHAARGVLLSGGRGRPQALVLSGRRSM